MKINRVEIQQILDKYITCTETIDDTKYRLSLDITNATMCLVVYTVRTDDNGDLALDLYSNLTFATIDPEGLSYTSRLSALNELLDLVLSNPEDIGRFKYVRSEVTA